jgi:hypothetical protein
MKSDGDWVTRELLIQGDHDVHDEGDVALAAVER